MDIWSDHIHSHMRRLTHTHMCAIHACSCTCTHINIFTPTHMCTGSHMCNTLVHTYTPSHPPTHTHTHTPRAWPLVLTGVPSILSSSPLSPESVVTVEGQMRTPKAPGHSPPLRWRLQWSSKRFREVTHRLPFSSILRS